MKFHSAKVFRDAKVVLQVGENDLKTFTFGVSVEDGLPADFSYLYYGGTKYLVVDAKWIDI